MIIQGDCIEEMHKLKANSVDAIITDPPYGLEFMGKDWDKFKEGKNIAGGTTGKDTPFGRSKPLNSVYQYQLSDKREMQNFFLGWAIECLRVLKPGGFLLAFGGTRTYHRLVCGIEDAGCEIRDTIMWLYGSGFPKSLNIGKQIDKIQGNEREEVKGGNLASSLGNNKTMDGGKANKDFKFTKGNSEWEGWGTALKPACEPIVVARKPLSEKNVALNVLKWGTGGINIDECRVGYDMSDENPATNPLYRMENNYKNNHNPDIGSSNYQIRKKVYEAKCNPQGRFPANIILDEEAGKMLDEQSGISKSQKVNSPLLDIKGTNGYGRVNKNTNIITERGHNDKGGASRFFYCAKASKSERNIGCEEMEDKKTDDGREVVSDRPHQRGATDRKNNHPTVKPIKLIEYLVKLVSKEGATILDPFIGSGTTAIACIKQGRKFIGIEKEEEYIKIANARIKPFLEQTKLDRCVLAQQSEGGKDE